MKSDSGMVPEYSDVIKRAQQGDSGCVHRALLFHRPQAADLFRMLAHDQQRSGGGRSHAGCVPAGFPQDRHLPRRRSVFDMGSPNRGQRCADEVSRKKLPCEVPLDEPYTNTDGAEMHREYGSKDRRLQRVASTAWHWLPHIEELPHGYRTIFLLHEVEGHEHQEIGEMLGCSVGNSKSQLHHAKRRMRRLLASLPEGRPTTIRTDRSSTKSARPRLDHPVFQSLSCGNLYVVNPQLTPSSPGLMAADS